MTLKQLAAKAFDEGQRIRLTAVPLIEKEIKGNMALKKKAFKTALEQKYEDLKSVNVSLSQANKKLQDVIDADIYISSNLYLKKRELEVRIEGMVAEVKGARATVEILKRDIVTMGQELNRVVSYSNKIDAELKETHHVMMLEKKELSRAKNERDTLSRLLKIIKATANGMTLEGEDMISPMGEGLNG